VPTIASLGGGAPGRRAPLPPTRLATRPAVATHAPPPAPVPFTVQQRRLEANGGRPLTRAEVSALRPTVPAGRVPAPPIRSGAAPGPGERTLAPARPRLPVTPEPAGKVFAPRAPAAPPPTSPLDRSYQAERATVEARHRQEFAKPPAGESSSALSQRQEDEDRELNQRYQRARAGGMSTMPPQAAPKGQKPAARAPAKAPTRERQKQ